MYVKSTLPARQLTRFVTPGDIQAIPIELNLRNERCLVVSIYRPPSQNNKYFINELIDYYSQEYNKHVIMGDFNMKPSDKIITDFIDEHIYKNLIKSKTCFKGPQGTCIDLLFTNKKNS